MTIRSPGAMAIGALSVAAVLAATVTSAWAALGIAFVALVGLSYRGTLVDRSLHAERQRGARSAFLVHLLPELLDARDADDVWARAIRALGGFLGATRVAVYRREGHAPYRLGSQFCADNVRPLDSESGLPSPLVELGVSSDKQVVVVPPRSDGVGIALVVFRAATDVPFLERFAENVRRVAEVVERHGGQIRLAELRSALLHLAHALASTLEPDATLDLAVTACAPLAHCHGAAVFLDAGESGWRTAAEHGFGAELTPAFLSRLLPRLDEAVGERVPLRFDEVGFTLIIVPMFHGRELMGALLLGRGRDAGDWDEADVEVARLTAQLTATSLKNAARLEGFAVSATSYAEVTSKAFDLYVTLDEAGVILDCNPATCETLGSTSSHLIGRRFEDILEPECARGWRKQLGELFRRGALGPVPATLRADAGDDVEVVWNGSALTSSEAHLVMKNVTEVASLEHQLRQSQKQEVLGLLASGIAHDLNNVLGGVLGYASLARNESQDARLLKYLETIERTAMRGAALTGRLLSASRKTPMRYEPVSLNDLVGETLELLSHTIPKNITIETHLDPAVRVMMADSGQLQQVLLNLCVNARDAMQQGGILRITTRLSPSDGRVQVAVEDSGVGMDSKTLEQLFEPFFSTKGTAGTGLGLSVVYSIVKSLSGEVRVQSSPGRGARFDVFLPCLWAEQAQDVPDRDEPLGDGELVLLVDDEKVMRELGKDILEAQGYRVEAVSSGEEAIEFVRTRKEHVSLVVLDLVMPGLDGAETYRRLRNLDRALPVLLSSGLSTEGTVEGILDERATGFLGKPYGMGELARAVRTAIRGGRDSTAIVH